MKVKLFLAVFTLALFISSCALLNQPGTADDDLYFSTSNNSNKGKTIIPTADIEKIKRDYPSQVDPNKPEGYYNDNGTANPNAVNGYPIYKEKQDSFYKIHPELAAAYQAYKMPPFSLREEYLLAKAERKQQRRLARLNNRYNYDNNNFGYNNGYNNNYGYNNGFYNNGFYNNGWGNNGFGPSVNFGWNSYNGWNTGIGFGFNNFGFNSFYNPFYYNNFCSPWGYNNYYNPHGYNNFYNPWGYNNFYNPYGHYNYYPNYNNGSGYSNETPNNNPPQSRPRQVIGSNLPATNGGTIDNPNPNPQRAVKRVENGEFRNQTNIDRPNQARSSENSGTLINTPNGVQYIAPRNTEVTTPTYSTYERSVENNNRQTEFRNANPQYANPVPIQTPNAVRTEPNQQNQTPVYTQPNYNNQNNQQRNNQTQPTYNPPVYNPPTYNTPRSNDGGGGRSNSGGSSSGGGGRSSGGGGGGGVSRPR
ncbi:MAG: hypothetical protein ACOYMA_14800 [Bacteroidia bacterium]